MVYEVTNAQEMVILLLLTVSTFLRHLHLRARGGDGLQTSARRSAHRPTRKLYRLNAPSRCRKLVFLCSLFLGPYTRTLVLSFSSNRTERKPRKITCSTISVDFVLTSLCTFYLVNAFELSDSHCVDNT